jgi:choline dehydrogenase-like flavoprotein
MYLLKFPNAVAVLDHRLATNQTAGYRYESMPPDRVVYEIGIEAIDLEAEHRYRGKFLMLRYAERDRVLQAIHMAGPKQRGRYGSTWGLRREMMNYNHWAAFGLLGEILPWKDNCVTLSEDKDRFGLPVAHVTFNLHENDKRLIKTAKEKTEEVMQAAGATEVAREARYAHLVGACRMGSDPRTSVVDKFGRSHDIPNLFVCDGSVFPTQGSANPGLTIPGSRSAHSGLSGLTGRTHLYQQRTRHDDIADARRTGAAGGVG